MKTPRSRIGRVLDFVLIYLSIVVATAGLATVPMLIFAYSGPGRQESMILVFFVAWGVFSLTGFGLLLRYFLRPR